MFKLLERLQFLPLLLFALIARYHGFTDDAWAYAFYSGGILALVQTLYLMANHVIVNRLMLAVNLFLIFGGAAFFTNSEVLLKIYSTYEQLILFAMLIVVAIVTTFFTRAGFIGTNEFSQSRTRSLSLQLLGFALLAFATAYYFQQYGMISAAIIIVTFRFINTWIINNNK